MAFEELKMDLKEADADLRSYLEHSEEHLKLKVFKVFMVSVTSAAQALLIGAICAVGAVASFVGGLLCPSRAMGQQFPGLFGCGTILFGPCHRLLSFKGKIEFAHIKKVF